MASDIQTLLGSCPAPILDHDHIVLGHGSGGRLTHDLIRKMILPAFRNPALEPLGDGATISVGGVCLAFSTDSFVVDPIFFPGGNIGDLAVHGTVNDLAMCGAKPLHLSASFVIEEGLSMDDLWRIISTMRDRAAAAGVAFVTGDTKVVDRGKADKVFINTSGIGLVSESVALGAQQARPGDVILLSGPIAAHGMAVLSVREGLELETPIASDTAALHELVQAMLAVPDAVAVLRDPTRGGVASALNEIAESAGAGVVIRESAIPVQDDVAGACELLGLDPLYVASEGRLLAMVRPEAADSILDAMHRHPLGVGAVAVGQMVVGHPGVVVIETRIGSRRVVDMLSGEQLPRIC